MKKLVFVGFLVGILLWLAGCGSTYRQIEVEYPISPYTKYKALNLEVVNPDSVDKEELESFRELIILALQKRGISVVDTDNPKLIVEVLNFNKDSKFLRYALTLTIGGPFTQYTSNTIEVKVSIKDRERIIELKEFQEYKEKIKDWEDLKKTVANRIADAVYFAN